MRRCVLIQEILMSTSNDHSLHRMLSRVQRENWAAALPPEQKVEFLEGKLSIYRAFVAKVMELHLSDEQKENLIELEPSTPPKNDLSLKGVNVGEVEILKIIHNRK